MSRRYADDRFKIWRWNRSQLSEIELSVLNDLLTEEDLLIKKFQMLAEHTEDQEISAKFTEISQKHQGHFNSLYAQLS